MTNTKSLLELGLTVVISEAVGQTMGLALAHIVGSKLDIDSQLDKIVTTAVRRAMTKVRGTQ